MYRERTAEGGQVGPVYSNPTIATIDIDAWLDRESQTDSGDIMPVYPTVGYMKAELCLNGHVITLPRSQGSTPRLSFDDTQLGADFPSFAITLGNRQD
jgi:hypothetical protein